MHFIYGVFENMAYKLRGVIVDIKRIKNLLQTTYLVTNIGYFFLTELGLAAIIFIKLINNKYNKT